MPEHRAWLRVCLHRRIPSRLTGPSTHPRSRPLRPQSRRRRARARGEPRFPDGPAADPAGSHHERRIRSFQPRRGRVTTGQARRAAAAVAAVGPGHRRAARLDLDELFDGGLPGRPGDRLRHGRGDRADGRRRPGHRHPRRRRAHPGQGNLLGLAERNGLTNVRVANGDAIILLREMLAAGLARRAARLLPRPVAEEAPPQAAADPAGVPRPGRRPACAGRAGALRDRLGAVRRADARGADRAPATREHRRPDGGYAPRPAFRPLTRFEGQGLDKGHVVHDLLFLPRAERTGTSPPATGTADTPSQSCRVRSLGSIACPATYPPGTRTMRPGVRGSGRQLRRRAAPGTLAVHGRAGASGAARRCAPARWSRCSRSAAW